jgi:putative NADH-flavin reductase
MPAGKVTPAELSLSGEPTRPVLMKITIFAATGGIGRLAMEQAIAAGHDVTAVARNVASLPASVRAVTADLLTADPATLQDALDGADAVFSGLGPRKQADAGVTSRGTETIVRAMKAAGTRRIVVVSAAPIGTVRAPGRPNPPKHDPGDGFFMRHVGNVIAKTLFGQHYEDLAVMEDRLRDSGMDWTIVRPPRLTDKPVTGAYRTAYGRNLRGGVLVSRADVAHLMLGVLSRPETIGKIIGIAN